MDWFIIVVGVLLLVLATPIALAWWKLARKAAPYRDEPGKGSAKQGTDDGVEVIVLPASGDQKRAR
jgi:hypothetical protein